MVFDRPNIKMVTNHEIKWENKEVFKHGKVGRSFTSRSVLQHYLLPIPFIVMLWTYEVCKLGWGDSKVYQALIDNTIFWII